MATLAPAAATFEAGGVEYSLRITTNAMRRYQVEMRETFKAGVDAVQAEPEDVVRLTAFVWAGLSPRRTLDETGDLIDVIGWTRVGQLLEAAIRDAFPNAEPGEAAQAVP